MQLKFGRHGKQPVVHAYDSLAALADDWRGILPLTRAYPTASELASVPMTLVNELYPVTPGEVYERVLGAMTTERVAKRARTRIITEINDARYLELILRYDPVFPSSDMLRRSQQIQHRLAGGTPYQSHVRLSQQLYALGLLVSTTGRPEGWHSDETLTIQQRLGEDLHHGNRETVTVACLAPYTPLMHRIAAYVQRVEKAVTTV